MICSRAALALAATFFVTSAACAVSFRANGPHDLDYGLQTEIPAGFGDGEFTLELRVRPDESFPVGTTAENRLAEQRQNWSEEDPAPYSRDDWWYRGNFLLDGHNNLDFTKGTFSIQFYGGGRVRWLFGDGVKAGPGGQWAVQAHPAASTPTLLDGAWHTIALVRRWGSDPAGADLELWVDGRKLATQATTARTDMRRYWNAWPGFPSRQRGWFWGAEKQAVVGVLRQYEDYKGGLDYVRFWSVARTPDALAAPNVEVAADAPGLVGVYTFPEQFGGAVCNVKTGGECITLDIVDRAWRPFGPRSGLEWMVVVALVWAAIMAAFGAARHAGSRPGALAWAGICAAMLALAAYVRLDLDLMLKQFFEQTTNGPAWYALRVAALVAALAAIAGSVFIAARALVVAEKRIDRATTLSLCVTVSAAALAAVRSVALHFTDSLLEFGPETFTLGRGAELACACTVAVNSLLTRSATARTNPT